jgi:hypothetical protein
VADQFGAWAPIGAAQTASGYEVAWKEAGADQYLVWSFDSNGNYLSTILGPVSGSSAALEALGAQFSTRPERRRPVWPSSPDGDLGLRINQLG